MLVLSNFGRAGEIPPSMVRTFAIPDVPGRLDHMDIDPASHRLFVAAYTSGSLVVVDLVDGNVKRANGFAGAHGVVFVQKYQRLYVTTDNGTVFALSSATLSKVASIKLPYDADNVKYDSSGDQVIVAFGQGPGAGLAFIDPMKNSILAVTTLGAHPEAFQVDAQSGVLYANVPDLQEVVRVSLSNLSVTAHWSITGFLDNFPMAYDIKDKLIIVATWFPPTVLAFTPDKFSLSSHTNICSDADDLHYVPGTNAILASCGQGYLDILRVSGGSVSVTASTPTGQGARTSLYSPDLKEIFVAIPQSGSDSARIMVFAWPS